MSNPMFSFWRCCVTGDTDTTKLKKKKKKAQENGHVEKNHNDDPADVKAENLELEYQTNGIDVDQPISSTPMTREKEEYSTDVGYNGESEVDSSIAPSEGESVNVPPSTVQIVKDGGNDATTQKGDIGSGGRIHLTAKYDKKSNKVHIQINKIEFGAYQEWKMQDLEVSCMLLPMRQQSFRRRSKRFSDPLVIQLPAKSKGSSLRFRIYDHKAITRKYLIGQGLVTIEDLKLTDGSEVSILLDLNSPDTYGIDTRYIAGISSVGQAVPDTGRPEMLISLEYRALTRKLIVEIIKTRGLGMLSGSKPQDVSVELKLIGGNKQVLRICRTNIKKHVIDTEFNEMFMFRLNIERLKQVTLQLSVIRISDVRNKKEKIGECSCCS